jgi:L-iditol 2-dehydrogenase
MILSKFMKCIELIKPYNFSIKKVKKPELFNKEVLIRVKYVGICGSDIHAFKGKHPYRIPPVILGHELVGIVEKVSKDVISIKNGDRVTVLPQIKCNHCKYCLSGESNLCKSKISLGTKEWPGAFSEYISAPERNVYKLDEGISDKEGVMVEPLAVAVHTIKKAKIFNVDYCTILGVGTIGLLCLQCLKIFGVKKIVVSDIFNYKLNIAKNIGAFLVLNPKNSNITKEIMRYTLNNGSNIIIITAGNQEVFETALNCISRKGKIIPVAQFEGNTINVKMSKIRYNEAEIIGSVMYDEDDFKFAIRLLVEKKVNVDLIISHIIGFNKASQAYNILMDEKNKSIKVLLSF